MSEEEIMQLWGFFYLLKFKINTSFLILKKFIFANNTTIFLYSLIYWSLKPMIWERLLAQHEVWVCPPSQDFDINATAILF